jgi:Cu/Ag efflux protein CusF
MRPIGKCRRGLSDAILVLLAAGLGFGLAGCARQTQPQAHEQVQVRHYQLKGTIVSVDKSNSSLVVDMEAIPGYMAAMSMSYPVHDSGSLAKLNAGDAITAEVVVARGGSYLDNVRAAQKGSGEKKMPAGGSHSEPGTKSE